MDNTKKNPNVPNLRFNYHKIWNKKFLQDICVFFKGNGISKEDLSDDGNPCILYGQLYTTYKNEIINEVISRTNVDLKNPFYSKKNDLIIPSSGEDPLDIAVARSIKQENVLLGGDLNVLRPNKEVSSDFLSYQLNGVRKYDIARIAQGKSIVHLHNDDLKNIKVFVPPIEEQKKIAHFLSLLDLRIEAQIKIINNLESQKNYIINRLIENENNVFSISELMHIGRGRVISNNELNKIENGKYPVYSSQTSNKGVMGYLNTFDFDGEYITWTTDGANAGTVYYRNGKFNCTNVCGTLKRKSDNVDLFYVAQILPLFTKKYVSTNLANPKLMNNVMGSIKIPLPSINIQKQHSSIIKKIKEKIDIETQILDNFKLQKIYLLNNLFI